MYYDDHNPPHFHAIYGDHEAQIAIDSLEILEGELPRRAGALVHEWAQLHQAELRQNWRRLVDHDELKRVDPLD
jgi:hypothetical protein